MTHQVETGIPTQLLDFCSNKSLRAQATLVQANIMQMNQGIILYPKKKAIKTRNLKRS